jgi:hypothetical protein
MVDAFTALTSKNVAPTPGGAVGGQRREAKKKPNHSIELLTIGCGRAQSSTGAC